MEQTDLLQESPGACAFCKIIRHEANAAVVVEDDSTIAFLDHRPLLRGHVLLLPRQHFETIHDLPEDLATLLFSGTRRIAKAVETSLSADGSFVAINTRISQSVPHLHIHIVPRWKKDGLFSRGFVWQRTPYKDDAEKETVRANIAEAFARLSGFRVP